MDSVSDLALAHSGGRNPPIVQKAEPDEYQKHPKRPELRIFSFAEKAR